MPFFCAVLGLQVPTSEPLGLELGVSGLGFGGLRFRGLGLGGLRFRGLGLGG